MGLRKDKIEATHSTMYDNSENACLLHTKCVGTPVHSRSFSGPHRWKTSGTKFTLAHPLKEIRVSRILTQESTAWNPESINGFRNLGRIIRWVIDHSGFIRVIIKWKKVWSSITFACIYSQDSDSFNRLCYPIFKQSSQQNDSRYTSKLRCHKENS